MIVRTDAENNYDVMMLPHASGKRFHCTCVIAGIDLVDFRQKMHLAQIEPLLQRKDRSIEKIAARWFWIRPRFEADLVEARGEILRRAS